MAKFEVRFRKSVCKDLRNIPDVDVQRILRRIETLTDNPRPLGCEKLSAMERYRIRQGDYRTLYEIEELVLTVTVVKVAHRRDVYHR